MDSGDTSTTIGRGLTCGWVVSLHAVGEDDAAWVGAKAATLARLARSGLSVPEGLVLTTAVEASVLEAAGLGPDATAADVVAAPLPSGVEAAIDRVADAFGGATLAVRSSGVSEDLAGASFAGQYETVLHVRGLEALRAAVRRCWASAHGERVLAYRRARGLSGGAGLAVLVQRQVDPDVAGVAFSANPVSGARDEVLVSAVPGLADTLVSGEQLPDEWVVTEASVDAVRVTHRALAEPQARAVAELARRAEQLLGAPQDVEWAMAGGGLVVLQARPITALPRPPAVELPPGTWIKDATRYPEPMTALGADRAAAIVSAELSAMLAHYGALLERIELRSVGGEMYSRAVPPGGRDGAPPPWWALALLARLAPPLRRRLRAAREHAGPEALAALVERWYGEWQPGFEAEIARARAVDLAALDDRALDEHLERTGELIGRVLHVHFHLIPPYAVPVHELVEACAALLGWSAAETLELLAGTSVASSRPVRELAELAERIGRHPVAAAAIDEAGSDLAERLTRADAGLGAAFAEWCDRHAFRCVNDDPGSPLLVERPWLLARLLRDAVVEARAGAPGLAERTDAARAAATERARTQLADRPQADRDRFERALAAALRSYPVREETTFSVALAAGLVRLAALEAGGRLAARGLVERAEDAVHLELETLRTAVAGSAPPDLRERVDRARAEHAWTSAHPGPPVHGPAPGPLPDVRGLPEPARRINAALLWIQAEQGLRPPPEAAGALAVGAAGSPGRYTGPVRIVRGEADFDRLRAGDVLVCATTDPAWSVLFGIAGALVTDGGGLLSHAAIVAREHAIPAVVGTGTATGVLHDGDVVTVDGSSGRVLAHI